MKSDSIESVQNKPKMCVAKAVKNGESVTYIRTFIVYFEIFNRIVH